MAFDSSDIFGQARGSFIRACSASALILIVLFVVFFFTVLPFMNLDRRAKEIETEIASLKDFPPKIEEILINFNGPLANATAELKLLADETIKLLVDDFVKLAEDAKLLREGGATERLEIIKDEVLINAILNRDQELDNLTPGIIDKSIIEPIFVELNKNSKIAYFFR